MKVFKCRFDPNFLQKTSMTVGEVTPSTVNYTYDALGRLKTIATGSDTFTYEYDNLTTRIAKMQRNGVDAVVNNYDILGRLTSKINKDNAGNTVSSYTYVLNDGDERTKVTHLNGDYIDYTYDLASQLIGAQKYSSTDTILNKWGYDYDPMGNRNTADYTIGSGSKDTTSYTANNLNQYTAINQPAGLTINPVHDLNGNTTSGTLNGFAYTWNDENRLVEAVKAADTKLEFDYDGQGRRRVKKVYSWTGSAWTLSKEERFVYDGWNMVRKLDSSNAVLNNYTWGIDLTGKVASLSAGKDTAGGVGGLLRVADTNTEYYPQMDGNGNITQYLDNIGNIVSTIEYDPFGKIHSNTGMNFDFMFSSKYTDGETDLVYYGYRYLDGESGRWVNRDPIGELGSATMYILTLNEISKKYCFVSNDGINGYDFLGLVEPITLTLGTGATIALPLTIAVVVCWAIPACRNAMIEAATGITEAVVDIVGTITQAIKNWWNDKEVCFYESDTTSSISGYNGNVLCTVRHCNYRCPKKGMKAYANTFSSGDSTPPPCPPTIIK